MHAIIPPIERKLLEAELRPERLWRQTNKANNFIYVFNAQEAPALMQEVGRLRELSFRAAGGGTGKSVDIDELDLAEDGYRQIIVWDPRDRAIVGGYRYIIPSQTSQMISTEHYFEFSDTFREEFLPWTIELGRSFVQPDYQARGRSKSIFALDNLWDGLGALILRNPQMKYMFGKVTMYGDYDSQARNTLIYFLRKHFPDRENLITSKYPIEMDIDTSRMEQLFTGDDFKSDLKILTKAINNYSEAIPPLINSYMNLSPTMRIFDTALNPDFGNVEETGLLITLGDLYDSKIDRHIPRSLSNL
ncbi:MAG: GNAT family N-acetyltransferase [Rikenellaceae bacterium]